MSRAVRLAGVALVAALAFTRPFAADAAVPIVTHTAADGTVQYPFPGAAPQLACAPLTVCTVTLQPGEAISTLATGDSARWIISSAPSGPSGATPLVLIKPKETGLSTNLVIATTRHLYYVDLISSNSWTNPRIGFYYPAEEEAARAAAAQAAAEVEARRKADAQTQLPLVAEDKLDTHYRVSGAKEILPQRVYNDGVHTYVEFDKLPSDLPILVALAPDGVNQIVNYRVSDSVYVVDGVPSGLELISNAGTGKHGSGERLVEIHHV
ncbi:MAG: TrbG/VirB9 family P-type conjugative transfer protein [Vulcanimicrobiaceae bacterium]